MDDSIKHIISKFKYSADTHNLHDNIPQWEKYLGIIVHNNNSKDGYYFVEMPHSDKNSRMSSSFKRR